MNDHSTIRACLDLADSIVPNVLPRGTKLRWLGEIEGKIAVELQGRDPSTTNAFDGNTALTTILPVPHPYDQVYWMYLVAMIHYALGDAARYEQAAALFNAAYRDYAKWLKRKGDAS